VYEALVKDVESGPKRLLLFKPKSSSSIEVDDHKTEPSNDNQALDEIDELMKETEKEAEEEEKPKPVSVVSGKEEKKKKITKK